MVALTVSGEALAALLPQKDAMCLLDGVIEVDEERIVCVTDRHRGQGNPLAVAGRLSPVAAIEMAAQAIAAHGALAGAGGRVMHGSLARVRDCVFQCERMETLPGSLTIEAVRLAAGEHALSYRFVVRMESTLVASGSALVALAPAASPAAP